MKQFEMLLPGSVDEAAKSLPTDDSFEGRRKVKVYAGGQDLLGEMKEHLEEPDAVVNLKGIEGLDRIVPLGDGGLEVGALVTLRALEREPWIQERFPMLAEAAAAVGSPQIRAAGTVGGNLCQRPRCWYYRNEHTVCLKKGGDECFSFEGMNKYNAVLGGGPSYIVHPSDLAPALISYDAEVTLAGPGGERTLSLDEFYMLPSEGDVTKETRLAPNEILTRIRIPGGRQAWRSTYMKVRERGAFDFALSAVALALRLEDGTVREARLTLGGVATKPWRCPRAEKLLVGKRIDDATCRAAGQEAMRGAEPLDHNEYKIPMTQGLLTKALRKLGNA
ncbi:MAG: xanthine dehydrogenase family protein subunit M [Planctomycetota bacterium]